MTDTTWDSTVSFGMGKPKGNGLSGFHKVGNKGVFSGMVYRGDTREPGGKKGLFTTGFQLHRAGVTVSGRTTSNKAQVGPNSGKTRGVVSASTDIKAAAYWAVHNTSNEGWLYAIYIEEEAWAADAIQNLMGKTGKDAAIRQKEIMFLGLPGNRIFAARKAKKVGGAGAKETYLVGPLVLNQSYAGNHPFPVAFKDPDYQILTAPTDQIKCNLAT